MKTTKTSEAIAERMRKRGFDGQQLTCRGVGTYDLLVESDVGSPLEAYEATGNTATEVYRTVERQWQKDHGV